MYDTTTPVVTSELWASIELWGGNMDKVNLPFFYNLGSALKPLTEMVVTPQSRLDALIAGFNVRSQIQLLFDSFAALTVCRASGISVIAALDTAMRWFTETPQDKRLEQDTNADLAFQRLVTTAREFQTVLSAELQTLAVYQVTHGGAYSVAALIEKAETIIPEVSRKALGTISPKTLGELNQAGRCIAFDLPTAAGFHIMRAIEVLLLAYCRAYGAKVKGRNWNSYIKALEVMTTANPKTLAVLDQIRDLHRNPTVHPEDTLTTDEGTSLLGIAQSVIIAMVTDIQAIQTPKASPPATQSGTGSNAP